MHSLSKSGVFFSLEIAFPIESMQNDKKNRQHLKTRRYLSLYKSHDISFFQKIKRFFQSTNTD